MSTSSTAYHNFVASGKQKSIKEKIVQSIINEPNQTAGEIASVIASLGHSVTPRFSELEREGIIHKSGQRMCEVTSQVCYTWALGGVKKEKKVPVHRFQNAMDILLEHGMFAAIDILMEHR